MRQQVGGLVVAASWFGRVIEQVNTESCCFHQVHPFGMVIDQIRLNGRVNTRWERRFFFEIVVFVDEA